MTSSAAISVEPAEMGQDRRAEAPWLLFGLLVGANVAAWVLLFRWDAQMGDRAGAMGMGLWEFLGCWLVMVVAMMLPTLTVVRFARSPALARSAAAVVFALGYLVVWTAIGIIWFPVSNAFASLAVHHRPTAVATAVATFVICALYQGLGVKRCFLERCCHPRVPFTTFAHRFRQGVRCGVNCLGASWPAMSLLIVVGLMQLEAMALIGGALVIERHLPRRGVRSLLGLVALGYGIAIALHPGLIPSPAAARMAPMGTMK